MAPSNKDDSLNFTSVVASATLIVGVAVMVEEDAVVDAGVEEEEDGAVEAEDDEFDEPCESDKEGVTDEVRLCFFLVFLLPSEVFEGERGELESSPSLGISVCFLISSSYASNSDLVSITSCPKISSIKGVNVRSASAKELTESHLWMKMESRTSRLRRSSLS